jgi:hypothetical protein
VLDLGCGRRLPLEPRPKADISRQLRRDHLDRDQAIRPALTRPVHETHPTPTGDALDPIPGKLIASP